jgi:hypothetical protein
MKVRHSPHDLAERVHGAEPRLEDLDFHYESRLPRAMHGTQFWRTVTADSCGAFNVFVKVARILIDAFWFSAVP